MNIYEYIGYTGSILVAISLMMKNIYHLRRINLVGASTFAFYGYLVKAYPVVLLNGFIALVDIYYLIRMNREKEAFSLQPLSKELSIYFDRFLEFYQSDIKKFFPDFDAQKGKGDERFLILRNMMPVGLLVIERQPDNSVLIKLDYAIPDYRDYKNGRFMVQTLSKKFKHEGIKKMIACSSVAAHRKYLKKIGFKEIDEKCFAYQIK
ncbi:MAG: YgjV family protein [Caldisericaceae bacterium]|nr:YgjV family protein [Caldisericaceae bacterium]